VALLGIVLANSIPVVGVVALGWNAAALVLLYWLELGVDSVWALVRALFAGRPPDLDRGGLLGGPLRLPRHPGALSLGAMGLAVAALFAIGGVWRTVALLAAASLAVPVVLVSLDHLLRYGALEYRVAPEGGAVVAYDRLFGTALWRVEAWDERALRVERTPVDALLGTETVTIELDDDEYVLPHLPDAEAVLAAFDRRPERSRRLVPGGTRPLG
jgi:hypothetical protein